jgi:hypothetical protein
LIATGSVETALWVLVVYGGIWAIAGVVSIIERIKNIPVSEAERRSMTAKEEELAKREREVARQADLIEEARTALDTLSREKSLGFPWLASAYAKHFELLDLKLANELTSKKHPALRAADEVRRIAQEKAMLRRENKVLRELHSYYENLFPWLIDFKGTDLDAVIQQVREPVERVDTPDADPAMMWLSDSEVTGTSLTRSQKFQRALDRYWTSRKTPWQIGRDYERYVGYLHEKDGFKVEYFGATEGLEDLGRDLICRRGTEVRIIQCKYWSSSKTLHEKHICQVYGTAAAYAFRNGSAAESLPPSEDVSAWLYTSCSCSEIARQFAGLLRVELRETVALDRYPAIKCNISGTGEKIYHLPFDQQYDRTAIDRVGECYVQTIAEAEKLGFRRAFRWKGSGVAENG